MDLQAAEGILEQLAAESARIVGIGRLRDELAEANRDLKVGLSKIEALTQGLETVGLEFKATGEMTRRRLDSLNDQLRAHVREIDQTIQVQLARTTGSFEALIRLETRAVATSTDLAIRELRQTLQEQAAAASRQELALSSSSNRKAWLQLFVTLVTASAILTLQWLGIRP